MLRRGLVLLVLAPVLWGADLRPSFELATVKQAPKGDTRIFSDGGPGTNSPEHFTFFGTTLSNVMWLAYGLTPAQISGPAWMSQDRFVIEAKVPVRTGRAEFNQMLQRLLEERFHIVLRHTTKAFPGYELTIAKGGHKLKLLPPDPPGTPPARGGPPVGFDKAGFPILAPGANRLVAGNDPIRGTFRVTMEDFAAELGSLINLSIGGRSLIRVVDRTGLTGKAEFRLEFGRAQADGTPSNGPSIFSAVEQQLGLKLVSTKKVELDAIVIEKIDRLPSGN